MKTLQIFSILLLLFLAATLRAGDFTREQTSSSRRADKVLTVDSRQVSARAAKAIERMRRHLEEWGTVNVSQPLLYPVNGQFSLGAPSDFPIFKEYYATELTNVTAAAGQLAQSAFVGGVSGNFNASQYTSPPAQPASSPGAGTGAVANPQFPLAPPVATTPTDVPASQAKVFLDQATFHKPGELLGSAPNGNAPHSAVNQSATDKITELLLRTLANPAPPDDGSKLYLAIFQVTCNPGWRTLKGYMADVFLHWEYARHCSDGKVALSLSNSVPSAPSVVAILPLVDAQNTDLRNSERELHSLLVSLAASGTLNGGNAAGKGVLDYIRSYQKDAASRNAMPVVNSYNIDYGMGFRFSPSFVAIADPARKKSAAANVLIPTSFPVLAVLRMRKLDAGKQDSQWPEVTADGYDELAWQANFRWLIRDRRISLLPWNWHLPERREDERRRLMVAQQSETAFQTFRDAKEAFLNESPDRNVYTRADYQLLRTDFEELSYKTGTNWSYSPLRDDFLHSPKAPVISELQPAVIDPTLDTKLTIQGENFKPEGLRVFLGGQECTVISVDDEKSVVALLKAGNLTTRDHQTATLGSSNSPSAAGSRAYADLVVATKTNASTLPVEIDLSKHQEKKAKEDKSKTVQVSRDGQGKIVSIDLSRLEGLPPKDVLDAVVKILGVGETGFKSTATSEKP
jgi:hypothetical protein